MAYSHRQNVATPANIPPGFLLFTLKEDLVASGLWTVVGSGNSVTHEFQGSTAGSGTGSGGAFDVWPSTAEPDSIGAWIVLEDTQGRQMLILGRLAGNSDDRFSLLWDFAGTYSATGVGPSTPPAATAGEQAVFNSRGSNNAFIGFSAGQYSFHVEQEEVNNVCAFHVLAWTNGGSRANTIGLFPITESTAKDGEPYVFLYQNSGTNFGTWEAKGSAGERWSTSGNVFLEQGQLWGAFASPTYPTLATPVVAGLTASTATLHLRGTLHGVKLSSHRSGSQVFPNYSNKDSETGYSYMFWNEVAFVWDDQDIPVQPFTTAGTAAELTVDHFNLTKGVPGGGDVLPPVVSISTPAGNLGSRTASVSFDVTDDVAVALVTVLVNFPTLGITECAFHDGKFRAPYSSSTVAANVFTLKRTGGWPDDFNLDVSAVDSSGNIQS